ncbi:MAG: type 4a pilus biogenesis protein PilO [Candidatus Omnitrophota bacterium]|nr:type 4a pilus biogenesis protein PilO [Candidatus Omnitrophota bacterium]
MDIKEKQKIYILVAIFGIAGLMLYYNLLLRPQFSKFIARNKEFKMIKEKVKSGEALIANEAAVMSQHENFEKKADYLEKRLPAHDQISSLLEDFSNIAESSGVSILRIKPLEEPTLLSKQKVVNNSYAELQILIEARAGYHQLGAFINKLETMDRFIRITGLDVAGLAKDPRHHDIKMRIITYVLY